MDIHAIIEHAQALREGGHVQRCHTTPHLGDASVAAHSWNMAVLLMQLWEGPPRAEFIFAILMHDVAERWVGDTPGNAKHSINPELGHALGVAEGRVNGRLMLHFTLTKEEEEWLDALDRLELLMYAEDQLALGNRNLEVTRDNCRWLLQRANIPPVIRRFAENYRWSRTKNIVPGEVLGG